MLPKFFSGSTISFDGRTVRGQHLLASPVGGWLSRQDLPSLKVFVASRLWTQPTMTESLLGLIPNPRPFLVSDRLQPLGFWKDLQSS